MKLIKNKRTGDYYTEDGRFQIERGTIGWNINENTNRGWYKNIGYADTLKEVRESIEQMARRKPYKA